MAASKRTLWLVLGLCLGLPLLGAAMYGAFVGFEVDVEPGDRERVVTVDDLGFDPAMGHETLTRLRYIDWTAALDYEYEDDEGLYIYSSYSLEHTERDARGVYLGQTAGGALAAKTFEDGVELVDSPDLFSWGDQHSAHVITVDGVEAGYSIDAREGKHVFSVVITGVIFEEGRLQEILVPVFERATKR